MTVNYILILKNNSHLKFLCSLSIRERHPIEVEGRENYLLAITFGLPPPLKILNQEKGPIAATF